MSDPNKLFLYLLGKPELKREGVSITGFAQKKSLALLSYLAVTRRSHTRSELAGLLWGENSEANARASLRKVLADLRTYVASHLIITHHEVAFNPAAPYWLDVHVFEQQVRSIQQTHRKSTVLMPETATVLADTVALYRGNFWAGLYVHRAPAFEEWVLLQQERLRLMALQAFHLLTSYYMAQGQYSQAVGSIEHLLALEPCQEDAHRQLMSILALSGQREAALRQYEICCRALAQELDVAPQQETTALYERIRADSMEDYGMDDVPCLPGSPIPLIGRKTETADILARLRDPNCRLLTLIGPGGSGKTRQAQEIVARLSTEQHSADATAPDVYFISCAPLQSALSFVPAVAQGINFYFSHAGDSRRQLLSYLRSQRMLLVLDNFEHLLGPSSLALEVVRDILDTAPSIKLLATSRVRLNLQAESLYPVAGLCVPSLEIVQTVDVASLEEYGAIKLFLWNMRQVYPNRLLSKDDLVHIVRICRFVQGMPLAILLAASWSRILSPTEIEAQLFEAMTGDSLNVTGSGTLDFLTTDWLDIPEQQRSMRAVFDRSWQLLTRREQHILAALSVFQGNFTSNAAHQICGASLRELLSLVDQSLLHRASSKNSTTAGRYELHDLLRHYAGEKLAGAYSPMADVPLGQLEQMRDRHSRYFTRTLQQWAADLKTARQQDALAAMDVEIANLRAAWDWAVNRRLWAQVARALDGLCSFYEWRGRYQEGASACQTAIAQALIPLPPDLDKQPGLKEKVLARLLAWQRSFSQVEAISTLLKKSQHFLEKAQQAGQDVRQEKAFVLLRLGVVFGGDKALGAQSLSLYRQLGDRWGEAQVLDILGWLAWSEGDYAKAELFYEQSLHLYQTLGDNRGKASALLWLGISALFRGRLEGEALLRESITIYQGLGDRANMANALYYAGMGLILLGKLVEAHTFLERSVLIHEELGSVEHTAHIFLGSAKLHLGQYKAGIRLAQTGLEVAQVTEDWQAAGYAHIVLGWGALVSEDYSEALTQFQNSIKICRRIGQQDMLIWALAFLGYAYCGMGQLTPARECLYQALKMAREIESFVAFMFILPGVVWLLIALEDSVRAIELYALLSRYPMVANSRWFADIVEQHLVDVMAMLPADSVAQAEESGWAGDLDKMVTVLLAELALPEWATTTACILQQVCLPRCPPGR
ncbi:MAG: AAA family ATPase [Anaerolineae bacterium]|nr:AAA family ATPase [Anaerolineae bacterium]